MWTTVSLATVMTSVSGCDCLVNRIMRGIEKPEYPEFPEIPEIPELPESATDSGNELADSIGELGDDSQGDDSRGDGPAQDDGRGDDGASDGSPGDDGRGDDGANDDWPDLDVEEGDGDDGSWETFDEETGWDEVGEWDEIGDWDEGEEEDDGGSECEAPRLHCEGECIDPNTSFAHCGASGDCLGDRAGQRCEPNSECQAGTCVVTSGDWQPPVATPAPSGAEHLAVLTLNEDLDLALVASTDTLTAMLDEGRGFAPLSGANWPLDGDAGGLWLQRDSAGAALCLWWSGGDFHWNRYDPVEGIWLSGAAQPAGLSTESGPDHVALRALDAGGFALVWSDALGLHSADFDGTRWHAHKIDIELAAEAGSGTFPGFSLSDAHDGRPPSMVAIESVGERKQISLFEWSGSGWRSDGIAQTFPADKFQVSSPQIERLPGQVPLVAWTLQPEGDERRFAWALRPSSDLDVWLSDEFQPLPAAEGPVHLLGGPGDRGFLLWRPGPGGEGWTAVQGLGVDLESGADFGRLNALLGHRAHVQLELGALRATDGASIMATVQQADAEEAPELLLWTHRAGPDAWELDPAQAFRHAAVDLHPQGRGVAVWLSAGGETQIVRRRHR